MASSSQFLASFETACCPHVCMPHRGFTRLCRCSLIAAALQGPHERSACCMLTSLGLAAAEKPGAGARGFASHVAGP